MLVKVFREVAGDNPGDRDHKGMERGQGGFHFGEGSELGSSWRLYAEGKAVIWTES